MAGKPETTSQRGQLAKDRHCTHNPGMGFDLLQSLVAGFAIIDTPCVLSVTAFSSYSPEDGRGRENLFPASSVVVIRATGRYLHASHDMLSEAVCNEGSSLD
jgi:hypothetical protein